MCTTTATRASVSTSSSRSRASSPHGVTSRDSQLGEFGESKHRYLAISEIDGDPVDAFAALHKELDSGRMQLREALGRNEVTNLEEGGITFETASS